MSLLRRTLLFDAVFLAVALAHLLAAPYTKVEESFSVQATHDILHHRHHLSVYDHLEFSGVVPRSFVGPLTLSALAAPAVALVEGRIPGEDRRWEQALVRALLGTLYAATFSFFRRSIGRLYGDERIANVLTLLTCCQFHVPFYCTRLLPNVFAAVVVNVALGCYALALREPRTAPGGSSAIFASPSSGMVAAFAFACVVFRCDMILLALPCILCLVLSRRMSLTAVVLSGALASAPSILLTVALDSYFWRRWVWPELTVLLYNNPVEGRYDQWGASPPAWYLTSALPRGLMATLVLVPLGLLHTVPGVETVRRMWKRPSILLQRDRVAVQLLLPAMTFVLLYSSLSHKELRFILPAFPLFTAVAAIGAVKAAGPTAERKHKEATALSSRLPVLFLCLAQLASLLFSLAFLYVSSLNYPGGVALARFHANLPPTASPTPTTVHLGNLACISGVTRFGERPGRAIVYNKEEGIAEEELGRRGFDFLIEERSDVEGYEVVDGGVVNALDRVDWRRGEVLTSPQLFVLKRKPKWDPDQRAGEDVIM